MPSSWTMLLQDRIGDEERSLAELRQHAERIDAEYRTALTTYEAASRALQELEGEKANVAERIELLRRSVSDMHVRLADGRRAKRLLQTMPTELLRAVFLELLRSYEPDQLWEQRARFNSDRARVPFLLSAVNRQFRELARDCPELWTYIGVPSLQVHSTRRHGYANLRRVKQSLTLSKNMPLDVLVPWSLEIPWSLGNEWHRRILDMLSLFVHRFRRAEIRLPGQGDAELPLAMFTRSMPMLEELTVAASSNNDVVWNPEHKYLQFCPRLRVLNSQYCNVVPASRCAVTSLTLRVTMPCDQIWELLGLAAPTVQSLDIGIQWLDPNVVVDPPRHKLSFPALKSLVVSHHFARMIGPWPGLVAMPALTDIEFDISTVGMLHRFAEQCAPTLRTLVLTGRATGYATDEQAEQLAGLENLEAVSLWCVVQDSFVQALVDGVWPKLKHFALVNASALVPRDSDVLPRLVRARNHAIEAEGQQVARIEKVTMEMGTVEDWVRGEVVYLLGDEPELSDGEPWGGSDLDEPFEEEAVEDDDEDDILV